MITLYTQSGCQGCRMSKSFLDRKGINYEIVDLDQTPEARTFLQDEGYSRMPVIITDSDSWTGFDPDKLAALA